MGVVIVLLCVVAIKTKEWRIIHDLITLGHTNVSPEILNSSELILWRLIRKVLIQKINAQVWLSYMKKKTTITKKIKKNNKARGQILIGT